MAVKTKQRKTDGRGGSRPGSGRKKVIDPNFRRVNSWLSPETIQSIKDVSLKGEFSDGLRILLDDLNVRIRIMDLIDQKPIRQREANHAN